MLGNLVSYRIYIYKPTVVKISMATVIIIVKLMPDSPSTDLEAIKSTAKELLIKEGANNISIEEKPVAFGLK